MEKYIPQRWQPYKTGMVILKSDKIDFNPRNITGEKEKHVRIIKWSTT